MKTLITFFIIAFSLQSYAQLLDKDTSYTPKQDIPNSVSLIDTNKISDTIIKESNLVRPKDTLKIIGVGDMMLGTNFPSKAYLPPDSGKKLLQPVMSILKNADLTFGNLEGTVLNSGGTVKRCSDPSKCYAFRMPEYLANHLVTSGFDVVSLANNHMGDFGTIGRKNTMKVLDKLNIKYGGLLLAPTTSFELNGIKYGLAAFSPNNGTVSIHDYKKAKLLVKTLDSICDIVMVSFHGGAEGTAHRHIPRKNEYYYGENRGDVYKFSHAMIDAGADIIFGHGPHVTRASEVYKNRFITYSMGNFCTYGRFSLRGYKGTGPIIELTTLKDGTFIKAKIHSIKQIGEGGPILDPLHSAYKEIKELTTSDFPESNLVFDDKTHSIRQK